MPQYPPVVLFDIDGTLTDTNYLHAIAWRRAFLDIGRDVPTAFIHQHIGAASSVLMERLLGAARDDAKYAWRTHFDSLKGEIRPLPGASALLRAIAAHGARVALATSSEPEDVDALLEALDASDALDQVTTAGDVEEAKPSPDVFATTLAALDAPPDRAIAVGDTVWDVEAARRCGLRIVCLRTGGVDQCRLEAAGATAVYRDPEDLLENLTASPIGALLQRDRAW
jgi:HAD superfamily hydrolase (TIGR01509 family)